MERKNFEKTEKWILKMEEKRKKIKFKKLFFKNGKNEF